MTSRRRGPRPRTNRCCHCGGPSGPGRVCDECLDLLEALGEPTSPRRHHDRPGRAVRPLRAVEADRAWLNAESGRRQQAGRPEEEAPLDVGRANPLGKRHVRRGEGAGPCPHRRAPDLTPNPPRKKVTYDCRKPTRFASSPARSPRCDCSPASCGRPRRFGARVLDGRGRSARGPAPSPSPSRSGDDLARLPRCVPVGSTPGTRRPDRARADRRGHRRSDGD